MAFHFIFCLKENNFLYFVTCEYLFVGKNVCDFHFVYCYLLGKLEAAKEVLRVTFEQNPCGFTFSLLQKFIRRNLGITAARRLFSETQAMRKSNPKLGLEVSEPFLFDILF